MSYQGLYGKKGKRAIIAKLLTKLMLESKLIWMYFQSNSIPLAPTQRGRNLKKHQGIKTKDIKYLYLWRNFIGNMFVCSRRVGANLDITSSAVAQPMAATMILYSPFPALRDITRWRPNRSARSTVDFMNSWEINTFLFHVKSYLVEARIKVPFRSLISWSACFPNWKQPTWLPIWTDLQESLVTKNNLKRATDFYLIFVLQ